MRTKRKKTKENVEIDRLQIEIYESSSFYGALWLNKIT